MHTGSARQKRYGDSDSIVAGIFSALFDQVRVLRLVTATPCEEGILQVAAMKLEMEGKVIRSGMFNMSATDTDRRKMLEQMLQGNSNVSSGAEIPDDSGINSILARTDWERALYLSMDQERLERDRVANGPEWKRLMVSESDIPDWVLECKDGNSTFEIWFVCLFKKNK